MCKIIYPIKHSVVHVDVEDLGAILNLLPVESYLTITAVQILCLLTFVFRNQQCKISNNKFKIKGTAQL